MFWERAAPEPGMLDMLLFACRALSPGVSSSGRDSWVLKAVFVYARE